MVDSFGFMRIGSTLLFLYKNIILGGGMRLLLDPYTEKSHVNVL